MIIAFRIILLIVMLASGCNAAENYDKGNKSLRYFAVYAVSILAFFTSYTILK